MQLKMQKKYKKCGLNENTRPGITIELSLLAQIMCLLETDATKVRLDQNLTFNKKIHNFLSIFMKFGWNN